ncbi:Transposase DDE domain protein [Sporotomaculum syntrophicum]|uniref:Transposase DDE domain protein n=1 Tax=Sporotomaculum syntrophicum TaxID=182264 RepID=A0A9D2WRD2_9FIRM|nr:Transposase DDE domain protein [Sporotomaculum syntrophicum]
MQDKDTTKFTFFQLLKPVCSITSCEQIDSLRVDKYAKKLSTEQLIILIIHAQLEQYVGLRDISNSLNENQFNQAIYLDSISASQISRRLRDLSLEVVQLLFKKCITEIGKEIGFDSITRQLGRIYLIDSSTISLCLSQYQWADFRNTKGGVKLHQRLRFCEEGVIPDKAIITSAKPADKTQMDELIVIGKDALNVFDRGYVDYKKFDKYCANGTRFVTRLKGNAKIELIKEFPVDPTGLIKKHQIVYLGTKGINRMKHPLRLIEVEDIQGKPVTIITNDFNLNTEEIGDIYRNRWQIELFFKWIKQHFLVKHFYGTSQQAVQNQLFIALITYCLLMLIKLKTGYKGPLLNIKRLLDVCLYEPFTVFVQKLYYKPKRKSKGRRKIDHEAAFQEVVKQVEADITVYSAVDFLV